MYLFALLFSLLAPAPAHAADARDYHDRKLGQGIACDAAGCIGKLADGALVAYDLKADAFEEDCRRAVLIMTTRDPPPNCRAQVIGRALWRERGALALRRSGSGFAIDSARPPNFNRPWAPQRLRATDTVTPAQPAASRVLPRDATPRQEDIEADE